LQSGGLVLIKVHGCQLGYEDAETGLPNFKPSEYVITMIVAGSIFKFAQFDGSHAHQPLERANCFGQRAKQASRRWSDKLSRSL
jgi:hypothetical protein